MYDDWTTGIELFMPEQERSQQLPNMPSIKAGHSENKNRSTIFLDIRFDEVEDDIRRERAKAIARFNEEALQSDDDPIQRVTRADADGIWHCCNCGYENPLIQIPGPHPFGWLKCGRCQQLWKPDSVTTNVLQPYYLPYSLRHSKEFSLVPNLYDTPIPYGQMCTCGLTHRGVLKLKWGELGDLQLATLVFPEELCVCGSNASAKWVCFQIGDNSDYRKGDPNATAARALERRLGFAIDNP
ncbi:hypothetical protein P154DRAFT_583167 [Amniculicola lignicola CBS 123094]|uniref:Probable double zinc ribbon domain-containing protein n=1 Tax=Amniculicola lignicola CBS 123094 TaxID=1392246 RepID=A0A6A5VUK2_9PLEO|nr:hypothetical protein P154DRAFT_583167 [Amniculicola lignicola CBS 123094]